MGAHLRVVSESYPMNTNMTGFRCFSKIVSSLCLQLAKIASALEGLVFAFSVLAICSRADGDKENKGEVYM